MSKSDLYFGMKKKKIAELFHGYIWFMFSMEKKMVS